MRQNFRRSLRFAIPIFPNRHLLCGVTRNLEDEEALLAPPKADPTPLQDMDPVYAFLKQKPFNYEIEWNYTKFLVGRDGQVRFAARCLNLKKLVVLSGPYTS